MKNEENSRYLNMLTDFGFKRILAQDESKPLLIHLLNVIIEGKEKIIDVLYLRSEQLGRRKEERKAIYDYINSYSIMNEKEHKRISNSLIFITIELPKFKKAIGELTNEQEAWLYCFCNLPEMKDRPAEIKGQAFDLLFEIADTNNLTSEEMEVYRKSVAEYADVQLMMACSLKEGRDEGMQKGILKGKREGKRETMNEIAEKLLKMNFSMTDIAQATGLTIEQISQL
jgi:predicted transposase/invertase (TIGR01784 family)